MGLSRFSGPIGGFDYSFRSPGTIHWYRMKVMGLKYQAGQFLVLALLSCASASATTVFVQVDPALNPSITVDRTVDGGASWSLAEGVGAIQMFTQPGQPDIVPLDFYTFCIEPLEFLGAGDFITYNLVSLDQGATNIGGMGATKANYVSELLYRFYPDLSVAPSAVLGAAVQAAIWEIVRETSSTFDLTTGAVQFANWSDDAARVLAASMLSQLTGSGPYLDTIQALALSGGTQDVLVQVTPEPSTFLLFGSALALFGLRRRKR